MVRNNIYLFTFLTRETCLRKNNKKTGRKEIRKKQEKMERDI